MHTRRLGGRMVAFVLSVTCAALFGTTAWAVPNGSFSSSMDLDLLTINYGTVLLGSGVHTMDFTIHNIDDTPSTTDILRLVSIETLGNVAQLSTNAETFDDLEAGDDISFQAELSADVAGSFSASYVFQLDDGAGGSQQSLALGLFADVVPTAGDFDADQDVDGKDFLIWQRGFGIEEDATYVDGDADGNGTVDAADLGEWEANFAGGTGTLGSIASVPEPTTIGMASVLAVLGIAVPCQHGRRN